MRAALFGYLVAGITIRAFWGRQYKSLFMEAATYPLWATLWPLIIVAICLGQPSPMPGDDDDYPPRGR